MAWWTLLVLPAFVCASLANVRGGLEYPLAIAIPEQLLRDGNQHRFPGRIAARPLPEVLRKSPIQSKSHRIQPGSGYWPSGHNPRKRVGATCSRANTVVLLIAYGAALANVFRGGGAIRAFPSLAEARRSTAPVGGGRQGARDAWGAVPRDRTKVSQMVMRTRRGKRASRTSRGAGVKPVRRTPRMKRRNP